LRENPLLWSRLVADNVDPESEAPARAALLQQKLRAIVEEMRNNPRDSKLYRALYHTYIQPAPTQEAAAELLDLPFSTYRRHLKDGVQRVVQVLWDEETGAA
jgi:hypothetical protein